MKRKNKTADRNIRRRKPLSDKKFNVVICLTTVLSFFGMLTAMGAVTAFSEKKEFSETENRYLAEFPEFSGKKIYNGSFTSGVEDFVTDHFVGHDGWITLKTRLEMLTGKRERNGIYILKNRLVEKVDEADEEIVGKSINGINTFAAENDVPVYVMIVPTSAAIYADELPPNAPEMDQKAFIDDVYSRLDGSIVTIDAYSAMMSGREDYIYYRNDHHWTSGGAFAAYTAAGKKMGYTPVSSGSFDIEHASYDFRGTFYSKVLYSGTEADTVDLWIPTGGEKTEAVEIYSSFGEEPAVYDSMYFRDYLDVKDKYSTFLGPNQPMVTIKTGSEGGRLLMFKDSYAHCYVQFLAQNYSEITLVDLRYIQLSYKELINAESYDQVMFLYNASGFSKDENLKKLMF
ncbi:MAG: DHHW family protein [Huintestinicola sp.]